ncbi:16S rRNA (cytosine(1407)-C(5))-methyltransferase RsmF [Catenovulum maritimum]|uniref:Ribosomal RNA small subunit methyltransferase F n=1 Tax=Catenovulum maritimum TaxID=1513271 RepID=A0A0J8GTN3_9ALTE|nr:16S rRNA (cytosine(1407)-C(5))-methyltransferase RsmF [Catenovulum maritimum]KMT64048.1 RNA methyltransferase RsmF [Catenovulum maritimum]
MNKTLLPQTFIDFISPYLPESENLQDFIQSCSTPLRKSIRVNTLKVELEAFKAKAISKGWELTPIPWCETGFWLNRPQAEEDSVSLGNTVEHLTGQFYIQEASSMLPPQALAFNNSINVALDVASAPGSKTTQLAALMNNQGVILANEYSSSRVKVLAANIQRCGVNNTAITHMDGRLLEHLTETFDSILLDAPCSGEGTVRKDPDSMKNWTEKSVHEIAETQFELIQAAFKALKVGGTLIYSTCTLNPYENQNICLKLQQMFPEQIEFESLANLFEGAGECTTKEGFLHVWPQIYDSEGFFVARIKKIQAITAPETIDNPFKKLGKFPYQAISKKSQTSLKEYLSKQFGCDNFPFEACYQRNDDIWYFPPAFETLKGKLKFSRVGVRIAELAKHGVKPDHALAINFSHLFTKQKIELDKSAAEQYLKGQDIDMNVSELAKGEIVVTIQNQALGFAKNLTDRLKNQLPRDLVRDNVKL